MGCKFKIADDSGIYTTGSKRCNILQGIGGAAIEEIGKWGDKCLMLRRTINRVQDVAERTGVKRKTSLSQRNCKDGKIVTITA